jgi:hypothetical protein
MTVMPLSASAQHRMFAHYNAWTNRIAGTIKYRCLSSPEQFEQQLLLPWRIGSITKPITGDKYTLC